MAAGWGALVGGVLQFLIQLPWVLKLDREIRINRGRGDGAFHEVVRNAGPAIMGRGVVQVSTYIDMIWRACWVSARWRASSSRRHSMYCR
ncbi:MAG: lipid II flippase MurJ [Pseudomonadota bacterium]